MACRQGAQAGGEGDSREESAMEIENPDDKASQVRWRDGRSAIGEVAIVEDC